MSGKMSLFPKKVAYPFNISSHNPIRTSALSQHLYIFKSKHIVLLLVILHIRCFIWDIFTFSWHWFSIDVWNFLYIALLILTNLHNLRQSRTGQTSVHPRALLIYNHEFMLDETERTRGNIIYYFVIHKYVTYTATH